MNYEDYLLFLLFLYILRIMNVLYYHDLRTKVDKNNGGHVVAR